MKKEAYKHDYSGSWSPGKTISTWSTFSVGCFQWVPRASLSGLKKTAVKVRVKGSTTDPEKVYKKAAEICKKLDKGWIPDRKTITV